MTYTNDEAFDCLAKTEKGLYLIVDTDTVNTWVDLDKKSLVERRAGIKEIEISIKDLNDQHVNFILTKLIQ